MAFHASAQNIPNIRWFCALCQFQCKSQVGFTKHCKHPEHMQKEFVAISRIQTGRETVYDIDSFSDKFKQAFISFVIDRTPLPFMAHDVYRKLVPNDRPMKRIQETCWGTLGRFCAHLREHGDLKTWKSDHGWHVQDVAVPPESSEPWSADPENTTSREAPARPQRTAWNAVRKDDSLSSAKRRRTDDALAAAVARAAQEEVREPPAEEAAGSGGEAPAAFLPFSLTSPPGSRPLAPPGLLAERASVAVMGDESVVDLTVNASADPSEVTWLSIGLRVRVVDTSGRFRESHLRKGYVQMVVSGSRCVVGLEAGRTLRDVHQSDLETVVSKGCRRVRVVRGQRRGAIAELLERHAKRNVAVVRTESETTAFELALDDICEVTNGSNDIC